MTMRKLARDYGRAYGDLYRWALHTAPLSWAFEATVWPGTRTWRTLVDLRTLAQ